MTFEYIIRVNAPNGPTEVVFTDSDLTDLEIEILGPIIARATNRPICENCLGSHPAINVAVQPRGKTLCKTCVELMNITAPERRHHDRRQKDKKRR